MRLRIALTGFLVPTALLVGLYFLAPPAPPDASADAEPVCNESGTISVDTMWGPECVHVLSSVTVSATLTLSPGTIIKASGGGANILVDSGGSLVSSGTGGNPVYITSISDDSVGGDTNGDGPSSGTRGGWGSLHVAAGGALSLSHTQIRYGGSAFWAVVNNFGTASITNSTIEESIRSGIQTYTGGSTTISDSTIRNNSEYGIAGGPTTISNSTIKNNGISGVLGGVLSVDGSTFDGNSRYGIEVQGGQIPVITNNTFLNNGWAAALIWHNTGTFNPSGNTASGNAGNNGFAMNISVPAGQTASLGVLNPQMPYIFDTGSQTVNGTLVLSPGTVIKVSACCQTSIIVYNGGLLASQGTAARPVYLTSIRDDRVGGDTNGDGISSSPARGDWGPINVQSGAVLNLGYTTLRYGGYSGFLNSSIINYGTSSIANATIEEGVGYGIYSGEGSTLSVTNSIIRNNGHYSFGVGFGGGISVSDPNTTISGSSIYGNVFGVSGGTESQHIHAQNNWWGASSGPGSNHEVCYYDAQNQPVYNAASGSGDKVSCYVDFSSWLTSPPPPGVEPPPSQRKVLFIQGIASSSNCDDRNDSQQRDNYYRVGWLKDYLSTDWRKTQTGLNDSDFLYYDYTSPRTSEGDTAATCPGKAIPKYEGADACWSLDDKYKALFLDWDVPNGGEGRRLARYLHNYLSLAWNQNARITIIGHSQGGVLAAYAMTTDFNDILTDSDRSKIDAVVTLDSPLGGVPELGADAYHLLWPACPAQASYDSAPDMAKTSRLVARLHNPPYPAVPLYTVDGDPGCFGVVVGSTCLGVIIANDGHSQAKEWQRAHLPVAAPNHDDVWDGWDLDTVRSHERETLGKFAFCAITKVQNDCRAYAEGTRVLVPPGGVTLASVPVATASASLRALTTWTGSTVTTTLVSPSSRVIDGSTVANDVTHFVGPTGEGFEVLSPEPGMWTAQLYGQDVPPGGETAIFSAATVPDPANDADSDQVADDIDNCIGVSNPSQYDNDGDGLGDACDDDDDNDGVLEAADNCPFAANAGQEDSDGNGLGDACDPGGVTDSDADGAMDNLDNCPLDSNPEQGNANGDAWGDACDYGNSDADLRPDYVEYNCASSAASSALIPERVDGAFAGVDDNGDTQVDEALPPSASAYDCDGDGFTGAVEAYVFSSTPGDTSRDQTPCAATSSAGDEDPDAWPTDNNDDQWTSLGDVLRYIPVFNSFAPGPPYDRRYDLNASNGITLTDVLRFIPFINQSCAP